MNDMIDIQEKSVQRYVRFDQPLYSKAHLDDLQFRRPRIVMAPVKDH